MLSAIFRLLTFCFRRKSKFIIVGAKSYFSCSSWHKAQKYISQNLWGKRYQVFMYENREYLFLGAYNPPARHSSYGYPTLSGDGKYIQKEESL